MNEVAPQPAGPEHYSYRVYRKPEVASSFHDSKFGDAVGRLVAERQQEVVHRFLGGRFEGRRVLDVGVGSGRVALPLMERGARVVGVDASPLMLAETAGRARDAGRPELGLSAADAHHLPFADRAFHVVLCFRVLMHVVSWRAALAELARVARDELVIDVPSRTSAACFDPWLKRLFGHDEQIYRTFTLRELRLELGRLGFEVVEVHRDFVLPFALHRRIGSAGFTRAVEKGLAAVGLNRLLGSPITIRARRRERTRVLMISPQPYFTSRGTPFSVRHRLSALSSLGMETDLVTYHIGEDVPMEGVRIHRIPSLPGIDRVRIGPSWIKIPLDALVALVALKLVLTRRYHLIQGHEEAGLIGVVLGKLFGIPHLYDMHSSLPEQLGNYGFTDSGAAIAAMRAVEELTLRGSEGVIAVCPSLVNVVHERTPRTPVLLIENRPPEDLVPEDAASEEARMLLRGYATKGAELVLYTGTLEVNQGLDMLVDGFPAVLERCPKAVLLLVGGRPDQVEGLRARADGLGLGDRVRLTGQRPLEDMPAFMAAADVLVSARCRGENSPLKLYSYLRWGKPIVATNLYTHTQVLDDEVALLTEVSAAALADGIATLLTDRARAEALGAAARRRYEERYTWERYVELTRDSVALSLGEMPEEAQRRRGLVATQAR